MKTHLVSLLCMIVTGTLGAETAFAQAGKVKANGIELAYERFGAPKKPVVLLIGGTASQMTLYPEAFCKKLAAQGFRVIRFDNRDAGLSTRMDKLGAPDWAAITKALGEQKAPPLPYSADDMADDAAGLLDALGIMKAHIVGVSQGGLIAQRIAYRHPEHVLSLASIMAGGGDDTFPLVAKPEVLGKIPQPGAETDTAGFIRREIMTRMLLAGDTYPRDSVSVRADVLADVQRAYYPAGAARQSAAALAGFYAGRAKALETIKVPTVVIHGSADPLVVVDAGKNVAQHIPGADFQLVEGMGHDLPVKLYDKLVGIIARNAEKAGK